MFRHSSQDHQEAVRLDRMCRHLPAAIIVLGSLAFLNVASAIASILAVSPVTPMQ
jgi:hypothetical protein